MGTVWVARNEATNAEVAIKVLVLSREGVDEEAIARFRREAYAAAQLYHRGIVRVFDLVELREPEEALVMVMELLRGETLANQMDRKGRASLDETLNVVLPLLSALAHAHAQGIVHRDLKPENVFLAVDPDGHVTPKILDFGISKLLTPAAPKITTDGAMLGTPNYMSPEQARGRGDVDARSDVFAAGILLYELLSGENPFASGSYHSVVAAILERDPPPIEGLAPEVWSVVKRSLEKTPALRYADAADLGAAIVRAAKSIGAQTPEASGAFPSMPRAPSMGDGSVPPAPYRDPEVTIPSIYRVAKRRGRTVRVVVAVVSVALAVLAAGVYVRVTQATHDAPAAAALPAKTPPPPAPVAPPPPLAASAIPAIPTVPAPTADEPSAPTPAPALLPTAHAAPRAAPAPVARPSAPRAPRPAPPSAASESAPAPSKPAVVRDPGF